MNPVYDFIQRNRVIAKIEKAHCSKARNLALDDFDLTTFPDILLQCHDLYSLNIGHNKIIKLPNNILQLKSLQHLSLEYNNFDIFPDALKKPNAVKILWCNSCCLTSLPEELGGLTKLETFGARHNKITKLPDGICNLGNLRWLTLEDNNLYTVPQDFDKLQSLVHVNFNKNNFNFIPLRISKIKTLKYLHLQNNEFFSLPEITVVAMSHTKINLLNNPLQLEDNKIFSNIVTTGSENEVMDFLGHDSDSSSDNWDNSLDSSDLNYSATESSDSEEEEVLTDVPRLSKFLVTF
ncbi:hypothetical protein NQ314_006794 [Rhamnusium bicolor]|uniref:Uncharacterized protein n=1 Tax=Rhamnusium bicolor TaxID=1586634 RepID=A0AAV8YY42_9CUCU|nr:hypothetical protein NQ314_006794 [Rhamnusium bicolor]